MVSEEWGPWIEHDGKGCPCEGMWVRAEYADGEVSEHIAMGYLWPGEGQVVNCWDWGECAICDCLDWRVIRYRIRKPRGMVILEALLTNLPETVDA